MRDPVFVPRRGAPGVLLAAVLALAPLVARADDPPVLPAFDPRAPLATDPDVARRTLANGIEIVVDSHQNPPGQVAVRVIVGAGSFAEEDDQVGAAYLAPRLLFARAKQTAPGERLARHPGVFDPPAGAASVVGNSAEHAWLALSAPTGDAEGLADAFAFVHEFLRATELDAETVAALRPQVQDEARRTESKADRLRRAVLPRLTPDCPLATHLAFPAIDDLCETGPDPVVRFARDRFAPMNTTVIVAGDVEPGAVFAVAERELSALPAVPAAPLPRPAIQPRPRGAVVIVTDPEATDLIAELIVTTPATGPARTASDARAALTRDLARTALDRRLSALLDEPGSPVKEVNAWAGDVPGPMFIGVASATGDSSRWAAVTARIVDAARTLAQQGVTDDELDAARRAHLARLEEAARSAPTTLADARAKELARAEATGAVLQSPAQAIETANRLLPLISAEEVSRAAAERLDPSLGTLVLVFPPDFPAPGEAEARRAMAPRAVSEKPVTPRTIAARAAEQAAPERALPGGVEELTVNPAAGVTSAWLSNGLRVHYRETPDASGQISFAISLIGGRTQEDEATRGFTLATQALWSSPASATISAAEMRERLGAIPLRLQYLIETDRVLLEFTVPGERAEDALTLITRLLEAPRLDPQAFDRWKWSEQRRIELVGKGAMGVLGAALERAVFPPNDPRIGSLGAAEIDSITPAEAQGWAEHLCGGPIEVGVAGDLRASLALEVIARTLGRLTPRQRPTPDAPDADAQRLLRPAADAGATIEYGKPNDPAGVLVSIAGADDRNPVDMAHMSIQTRMLRAAVTQRTTVDRSLAQRIIVTHSPGAGLPGSGLLNVWGFTEPGLADILTKEIDAQIDRLSSDAIAANELAESKAAAIADLDRVMLDPRFWAHELSDRTFRSRSFDEPQKIRQAMEAATAADLAATLARFDALNERLRFKALPITTPR